jgi:hypothetical protein
LGGNKARCIDMQHGENGHDRKSQSVQAAASAHQLTTSSADEVE